ncbi:MAG: sulfotransferase domain-containing protein [Sedimentisphaerales bacterium]|nr:sulfotransferase domain-containing protein [Sedimentisphaerales bacterium]
MKGWENSKNRIDFLVAGVQKAGTTALFSYLNQHPEIYIPEQKELHYFDTEEYFQNQSADYSIYHRQFTPDSFHVKLGEITPIYIYWSDSMKRIREYNPQIGIIVILRNPITRAYSHWNMETGRGAETVSFYEAITTESQRLLQARPLQHRVYSYVDRGFYVEQLNRVWRYFPVHRTLILRHEELRNNPQAVMDRVFQFLGVGYSIHIEPRLERKGVYSEPMTHEAWNYLRQRYEQEINQLEQLLEWDCSDWLDYDRTGCT